MHVKTHIVGLLLVVVAVVLGVPAAADAQKLVLITRHAERADEPGRRQEDPPLSRTGEARAQRLRAMLHDADIRAIFVTQYKRTQQTAAPLAAALKLKPQVMPPSVGTLVNELRSQHANDVIFIVAHSTTIPGIIKGLGGASKVEIGDEDYDNLFLVVPATGTVTRIHY